MAMAVAETEKIAQQLEALISDFSHIISYKWVSRKFLISSNAAKSLLHEFVIKHGNGLEVVYALSGWTQEQPRSYSIQLVKSAQLEVAKAVLAEGSSVHVYSVQASLPKDPAQLWSPDYVQAEELFNQPPHVVNCLRDNRFSGVSFPLVTRDLKGGGIRAVHSVAETKSPAKLQVQNDTKLLPAAVKLPEETNDTVTGNSNPGNNEKLKQDQDRSKTNLWEKNSTTSEAGKNSPGKRAASGNPESEDRENDANSEDDVRTFVRLRRGGTKRRVIFDDETSEGGGEQKSDEEEIVSLVSPVRGEDKKPAADQLQGSTTDNLQQGNGANKAANSEATNKRKKILKTRIDERGREVTEVIWDTEEEACELKPDKPEVSKPKPEAPPVLPKQTAKATSKVSTKPPAKSGKGAKTGPQQGTITSFFKKK